MRNFKNVLAIAVMMLGATLFAQSHLSGKVVDENNQPLPGADVLVVGTTNGTSTDFDGNFALDCNKGSGSISVGFMGFETKELAFTGTKNFGTIQLMPSAQSLDEVVIVGVADIAKDRETPVAVSTIKATEIVEKVGNQELPELLNATPSVYATKQGGGYGDARINIRGFDSRNTAVMINGMPVNDMESGKVYWSNWAGLSDVTTAMQVQRGLGSSKLAISSVGGTINVLTKTSDARQGGAFSGTYGNDNFLKVTGSYSTGKLDSGLSASVLLSQFQGDGYADGTKFQGNTYFIGLGYEINENNSVMFTATGAPQWHHQRYYAPSLGDYLKYGEGGGVPNIRYNGDWGYLNGEEYTFRRNFYHKPIASLNWDLKLNETAKIATVLYASWGRGGGTGPRGGYEYYKTAEDALNHKNKKFFAEYRLNRTADGLYDFDFINSFNQGQEVINYNHYDKYGNPQTTFSTSPDENGLYVNAKKNAGFTRRASMNSHDWYGIISNFHKDVSDNFGFDFGIDARTYKGYHYRIVNDLLGADRYFSTADKNNPERMITEYYDATASWNPFVDIKGQQKIHYYNVGAVNWLGAFGQLEYKKDAVSTFLQFGVSQQGFQRTDYFNLGEVAHQNDDRRSAQQTSDWENLLGGNVKTGLNYNINEHHNVFVNAGYYSKQPHFDAVYPNYNNNDVNADLTNETVIGVEAGYGYRSERMRFNLNVYRTEWNDRFKSVGWTNADGAHGSARMNHINELHMGVEADASYKPMDAVKLTGMISVGDWTYNGNPYGTNYDEDQNDLGEVKMLLDGVKVGDAAQFTSRLGMELKPFKNFTLDVSQFMVDHLYADLDVNAYLFDGEVADIPEDSDIFKGALRLPAYSLTNAGIAYKFHLGEKMKLKLRFNVNNLWDHTYISESETNRHAKDVADFTNEDGEFDSFGYDSYLKQSTYRGIDNKNRVFFGFGRTWNVSARFTF